MMIVQNLKKTDKYGIIFKILHSAKEDTVAFPSSRQDKKKYLKNPA